MAERLLTLKDKVEPLTWFFQIKNRPLVASLTLLTKTDHHPIFTSILRNRISKEDKSTKR